MKKFANKYKQRLLKLAEHLENGKLFQDKFDFSVVHEKYDCGTVGCALGECPAVWPRSWGFDPWDVPVLKESSCSGVWTSVERFFGIDLIEAFHLFAPNTPRTWMRYTQLSERATRKQVAKSIRKFVEWKEAQV